MSLVQPQTSDRRPAPLPPLNPPASTNNPFRRGANSPALSPSLRSESPAQRPRSTNPFLDNTVEMEAPTTNTTSMSPQRPSRRQPPSRPGDNEALLRGLTLEDKPSRGDRLPPRKHQPSNSFETGKNEEIDTLDIFADPPPRRPTERRPRRNSESSIAEHKTMEDDEKRRRDRERHHRDRPKDSQGRPIPSKGKKPSRRLDMIDKLDVTSIYGTGMFHHGGPYDALNPHRNRNAARRAPMQAFPKDSLNNVMGGSGPLNKNIDLDRFHGHTEDSFKDFNSGRALNKDSTPSQVYEPYVGPDTRPRGSSKTGGPIYDRSTGFDPATKVDPIHADESVGLGTSTFFEGTPATRSAIQRRDSETDGVGLTRKKSLAQKIRGISNNRPRRFENGEYGSPTSPEALGTANSQGKPATNERNPFFQDYDQEYERKGQSIRIAEQQKEGESSAAAPPLTRSVTEGGSIAPVPTESEQKSGGFLSRVKSLRGGGRGKPRS